MPGLRLGVPAQAGLILACGDALNRTGCYARVLEWFPEVDPANDATGALAVERGRACNGTRRFAAAPEELAPVIRRTSRARSVRCTALEQRALANLGLGRRAQGCEDAARIADLAPDFPSLRALRWLVER